MMNKTIKLKYPTINGYDVYVKKERYYNGRLALELICVDDKEPYAMATINVPEIDLKEHELIIKNYSENEGVLELLQKNNIVGAVKYNIENGWVTMPVVDYLL